MNEPLALEMAERGDFTGGPRPIAMITTFSLWRYKFVVTATN
jgi:hypothetical protein